MNIRKSKFSINLIYNFLGYGMVAASLQLVIIPILGRILETEQYGRFQTIISIYQLVPAALSITLNNLRLITENQEKLKNFEALNRIGCVLSCFASTIILLILIKKITITDWIIFILTCLFWTLSEYYICEFRINYDYKKICAYNFTQMLGYWIGLGIFLLCRVELVIYLCGIVFGYIYTKKHTSISHEKMNYTVAFKNIFKDYLILLSTKILVNIFGTCDRMLIMPILGAESVAVYTCASIFTKIVSMFLTPINGVILSALSRKNRNNKIFYKVLFSSILIGIFFAVVLNKLSFIILNILYPLYSSEASKYACILIINAMVQMVNGVISPFVLKYCDLFKQSVFQLSSLLIYFAISFFMINKYHIWAVCYALLISNIWQLIIYIILFRMTDKNEVSSVE